MSQILRKAVLIALSGLVVISGLVPVPATAVTFGNPVDDPIQSAPYVVSIWKSDKGDVRQAEFICSGTLISSNIVLTAAHCTTFPNASFFVKIGALALREDKALYPATPWTGTRYDPRDINGDIGLLRVNTKIEGMTFPSLANANIAKQISVKTKLTLMGWGLNQNQQTADTLQYSTLSLQDAKSKTIWGKLFNVKTMISAGKYIQAEKKWSGACNGDSGGPLFAKLNGINYVVGITSWGASDCRLERPSIFSRVSYYEKDIRSGIKAVELLATSVNRLAPVEVISPTMQGEGTPGTILTCNPGTWENVVSVDTTWISPARLQGTSNPATKIISADAGLEFKCRITAKSKSGDSEATVIRNVSKTLPKVLAVASKPTIGGLEGTKNATPGTVVRCEGWNWAEPVDREVIEWFTVGTDNPTTPVNGKFIGSGKELTLTQELLKSERGRYLVCQLTGTRDNFPSYLIATKLLTSLSAPVINDVFVKSSSLKSGSTASCTYSGSTNVDQVAYQWGYTGAGNAFTPLSGQTADFIQITSQVLKQASGQKLACRVSLTSQGDTTSKVGTSSEIFESALEVPKVTVSMPVSIYSGSSASCSVPYSSKYLSTTYEWGIANSPTSDVFLSGILSRGASFTFDSDSILRTAGYYLTCVVTVENEIGKSQGVSGSLVPLISAPALPAIAAPSVLRQDKQNSSVNVSLSISSVNGFNPITMEAKLKFPGASCDGSRLSSFPTTVVCGGLAGDTEHSMSIEIRYSANTLLPARVSPALTFRTIDATAAPSISLTNALQSVTANSAISIVEVLNSGGKVNSNGYSINPTLPSGLYFNSSTGAISGSPSGVQGQKGYTVTATGPGGSSTATFFLTVVAIESAPNLVLSSSNLSVFVNSPIQTLSVTNVGGTILSNGFTISPNLIAGLNFDRNTGSISGTPTEVTNATAYRITANGPAGTSTATFTLTVSPRPAAPSISLSNSTQSVPVNSSISTITISNSGGAINSDGYSVSPALPSGIILNSSTGTISGIPTSVQTSKSYTLTAVGPGGTSSSTFTLTVTAPVVDYNPPVVVIGSGVVSTSQTTAGSAITATFRITDDVSVASSTLAISNSSNQIVAQTSANLTSGTDKDGNYQASIVVPVGTPVGTYRVIARATDPSGKTSVGNSGVSQYVLLGTFAVILPPDDQAPSVTANLIQISPTSSNENGTFTILVPASDNRGVTNIEVTMSRSQDYPTTPAQNTTAVITLSRSSGTALTGNWTGSKALYVGAGSNGILGEGYYNIIVRASDAAGNQTEVTLPNAFMLGMQASGPYISSTTTLPLATPLTPGTSFKIQTRINAYGHLISSASARSDGYNMNFSVPLVRVSGTTSDGIYEATITLASNQAVGTYTYWIEAGTDNGRAGVRVDIPVVISSPTPTNQTS